MPGELFIIVLIVHDKVNERNVVKYLMLTMLNVYSEIGIELKK